MDMALWKRGRRYWTYFSVNGVQLRRPLCVEGSRLATTNWQEATRLEKEVIRAAMEGELAPRDPSVKLFGAVADYLKAKEATANSKRTIAFDRERLAIVKRLVGDVKLTAITRKTIEGLQAKRRLEGAGNRTINMDVGALRQVLRRFKQWRRLEDDVKMLTEAGGVPVGRALTVEEQKRLFESAASNPEWEHVYCAAVLAANTSMRGVEVKHVRRRNIDLEKVWDVESATGKGVLYVTRSKNETSKRPIPLNQAAKEAVAMAGEQPRSSAPAARPKRRKPSPSAAPRSSVRRWTAEPRLARSNTARRPDEPAEASASVSGSRTRTRTQWGATKRSGSPPSRERV
jgi:integrase